MSVFSNPGKGSHSFYPYLLEQSCRFNSDDSAWTGRTNPASSPWSNSVSFWVKRGSLDTGDVQTIIGPSSNTTNRSILRFAIADVLNFALVSGGVVYADYNTDMVFRDSSAWYHIVVATTGNAATPAEKLSIYVNGVELIPGDGLSIATSWVTDVDWKLNANDQGIGREYYNDGRYFDGYLSELHIVDGLRKTAADFGAFKNGIWVPIKYTGSHGSAGAYLDFSNSSDFGEDQSGNNNDLTDSSLATNDQVEDSPTNNFCVFNSVLTDVEHDSVSSNGNLDVFIPADNVGCEIGTHVMTAGTFYWEMEVVVSGGTTIYPGITQGDFDSGASPHPAYDALGSACYVSDGNKYVNQSPSAYGSSYTTADIIGFALDVDGQTLECFKNNISQGVIDLSAGDPGNGWTPGISDNTGSAGGSTTRWNFGQQGFTYTPPAGFKTICSKNLPQPLITEGNRGFDVVTYTGDGAAGTQSDVLDFSPDLVWVKNRDQDDDNMLWDSVRDADTSEENLVSNETDIGIPAFVLAGGGIGGASSNGFTLSDGAINAHNVNASGEDYVAWCWKESPLYGFDITTYVGTGANMTVAHNLGVLPEFLMVKARDSASSWLGWHKDLTGLTYALALNGTNAEINEATYFNSRANDSSTLFTIGTHGSTNVLDKNYIAYLFASVAGFSKVFSYTGNASADGPFVHCGFRPRYVLIKNASIVSWWLIADTERTTYNWVGDLLYTNVPDAEGSSEYFDFLSNGIKVRNSNTTGNGSGNTVIGIAFAEHPFKYANAR